MELLRNLPLQTIIDSCPPHIYAQTQIKNLNSNEILFFQGEPPEYACIILKGNLKSYHLNSMGDKYFVAIHYPGEIIGDIEILDHKPCICTVESISEVMLLCFSRSTYQQWLKEDTNFNLYINQILCEKFYLILKRTAEEHLYPLKYRLLNYILYLYTKKGANLVLQKRDLEETLGVTLRSINRIIKDLNEKKILQYHHGEITILSVERLNKELWLSL